MTRLLAISLTALLLAWTPHGTSIWGVDDSEAYVRAEHAYEARALCTLVLSSTAPVLTRSGNTGAEPVGIAHRLCEHDAVAAPFLRLLESGLGAQLEAAKAQALEAIR